MSAHHDDRSAGRAWLPDLVPFSESGGDWNRYVELLYSIFVADFVASSPTYRNRRWAVKRHPEIDGKEATFWHIVSAGEIESERIPDLRRCERIRWPQPLIDACATDRVCWWEQERKGEVRVAIATPDFDYLVILADRKDYALLWTAYPVEREHQRRKLEREYREFHDLGNHKS